MTTVIVWFRRDLRLADNPALTEALRRYQQVVPVYIHDDKQREWPIGGAAAWWLYHSLGSLRKEMRARGGNLIYRLGDAERVLRDLIGESGARAVYWNRCYEPYAIERDTRVKTQLLEKGIDCRSFKGSTLFEPWEIKTVGGTPYQVFTPFWRAVQRTLPGSERSLLPAPRQLPVLSGKIRKGTLKEMKLLPDIKWYKGFTEVWQPGEAGAQACLKHACRSIFTAYPDRRDIPGEEGTSRLSPHLSFGELSPYQLKHALDALAVREAKDGLLAGMEAFFRQLVWRDFAYHLLFHFPHTDAKPLRPAFERFPWRNRSRYREPLRRWQQGLTGIPIVDAGMRQLWRTGWMHNRVRMIVASFLTKNLLTPWQEGAAWFWDTLVDADLANNSLGWQWVAGSGADAAPYFRIFNPVSQGERFDPDGGYVRRWVPELSTLDRRYVHRPWEAPEAILRTAKLRLGKDYPLPIVDLKVSREAALDAYQQMKKNSEK